MGVVNATPDSFSGDGVEADPTSAGDLAAEFERAGADMVDVGAVSTRPDGPPVSLDEELRRLSPALEEVRRATSLPVSVDTWRAPVAEVAIDSGADIVNDVHGLLRDSEMANVIASAGVPCILMHNQRGRNFKGVVASITEGFEESLAVADSAGIDSGLVVLDPGFGFGWTPQQNLEMVRRLPELWKFQLPLLLGVSRKSTIGTVLDRPVDQRLEGTLAAVVSAIGGGGDIVRVHDVPEVVRAVRLADAIVRGNWNAPGE
jgi:dihydropteroate synthase